LNSIIHYFFDSLYVILIITSRWFLTGRCYELQSHFVDLRTKNLLNPTYKKDKIN
jgi:hypothetical protein